MPEKTTEPQSPERIEDALKTARRLLRRAKKARKALESIRRREPTPTSVADFLTARDTIDKLAGDTGSETFDAQLHAWLEAVEPQLADAQADHRRALVAAMKERAEARDICIEKLGDSPLTFALGPFRLAIPLGEDASLQLGREPICDVEPECDAIFEACDATRALWAERSPEQPDAVFDRLYCAYRAACAIEGKTPGDRVAVVDLLGPLALLESRPKRGQNRGFKAYPRHLLARQLAELARQRHLEHRGVRLELGAATGGSTSQKQDVLFVPTGPGRGQYYLSVRFVRQ